MACAMMYTSALRQHELVGRLSPSPSASVFAACGRTLLAVAKAGLMLGAKKHLHCSLKPEAMAFGGFTPSGRPVLLPGADLPATGRRGAHLREPFRHRSRWRTSRASLYA